MATPLVARCGRRGLAVPLAAFRARVGGEEALRKLLRGFTVVEKLVGRGRPPGMAPATRRAYELLRGEDTLILPRAQAALLLRPRGGTPLLDAVAPGAAGTPDEPLPLSRRLDAASCVAEEPLYDYQEAAVAYIADVGDGADVGDDADVGAAVCGRTIYMQMNTGLGKTRVGCAVVARRGEPGLVVVPTEAIAFQWLEELAASFPRMRGGLYRNEDERRAAAAAAGGRALRPDRLPAGPATHDLVVVIINTFREKTADFLRGYGVVVLDEAHELQSPHNGRALWLAQTRLVLGLSATPLERPDGLDRYPVLHLGAPVRPEDIPGGAAVPVHFRGEVRLVEYAGRAGDAACETVTGGAGTMSAVLTIGRVLSDAARRRMVALEVRRLLRAHEELPPAELARCGLGPRPESAATPCHPAGEVRRHGVFVFAELREALPALRDELSLILGPDTPLLVPELDGAPEPAAVLRPPAQEAEEQPPAPKTTDKSAEMRAIAAQSAELDELLGEPPALAPAPAQARAQALAQVPTQQAQAPVSILRGGVARDAVSNARALRAHVVLTTYGFSRRGISLPDMTALVLASPRRNGSTQTLGRIERRGSDESILRAVVDIVDVCTGLRSQASERKRAYIAKGYPVSRVQCSYEEFAPLLLGDPAVGALADAAVVPAVVPAEDIKEVDNDELLRRLGYF